jgi:hypothetical protein
VSVQKTQLKRLATGEMVEAELHTQLGLEDLLDAEAQWTPHRVEVLKRLLRDRVPDAKWPQNFHWNWALKAVQLRRLDIGSALSPIRLMGIKAFIRWQGIVMAKSVGHVTRLATKGRDLLYVEYVESAPWNLEMPEIAQRPELTGTGRQLMESVVRLSRAMDFEGRVGLHSLEQAEGVYRRWGLTDLGNDPDYLNLRYFEMSEAQARTFLREDN